METEDYLCDVCPSPWWPHNRCAISVFSGSTPPRLPASTCSEASWKEDGEVELLLAQFTLPFIHLATTVNPFIYITLQHSLSNLLSFLLLILITKIMQLLLS